MTVEVEVKLNQEALGKFVATPDGPVARQMMLFGEKVKSTTIGLLKEGFPRDFLGPTILKRWTDGPEGPVLLIGSPRTQTQPHVILGNPLLVFFWPPPKGPGRTVYFTKVNHPGSNFDRYLGQKLLEAIGAPVAIPEAEREVTARIQPSRTNRGRPRVGRPVRRPRLRRPCGE